MAKIKFKNCARKIAADSKGAISEAEARAFLEIVSNRARRKRLDGDTTTLSDLLVSEGNKQIKANKVESAIQKRNAKLQALSFIRNKERLDLAGSKFIGLKSLLGGHAGFIRASVDVDQKATRARILGDLHADLDAKGLVGAYNKDEVSRALAKEMAELNLPNPKANISGNPRAFEIAKIINKHMKRTINELNSKGAWIREVEGYITRQSHDSEKLRKMGFAGWYNLLLDKLDKEATFKERGVLEADEKDFLLEVYDNLVTGDHNKHGQLRFGVKEALSKSGFVAKKNSHERVIHFRDSDAWFDYNLEAGTGSLQSSINRSFQYMADDLGLMQNMGPNPHQMLEDLKRAAINDLKPIAADVKDLKASKRAQREIDKIKGDALDNIMSVLDGSTDLIGGNFLARQNAALRAGVRMNTMGATVLTSFTDVASTASEMNYQFGTNYLGSVAKEMTRLGTGLSKEGKSEMYRILGVMADRMIGEYHMRFDADGSMPGQRAKLEWIYYTLNGQRGWDAFRKSGAVAGMLSNLAGLSKLKFNDIPMETRRVMGLYEIDESQWSLFKKIVRKDESGTDFVTPELVKDIEDSDISKIIGKSDRKSIDQYKQRLERNVRAYAVDRADHAVPTPGANERAILLRGTQRGTPEGEALRHFAIFKSFPTAYLSKIMMRDTSGKLPIPADGGPIQATEFGLRGAVEGLREGKGAWGAIAQTMVGMTGLAYMSMVAKDLAKGLEPRDPTKAETWLAAMAQGGGFGIYGDFMFGEFNRYGMSVTQTFLGPTANLFDDIGSLYAKFRDGDDVAASAVRIIRNNMGILASFAPNRYIAVPAILTNMFYTRAALDHLFLYQLQENMNPGFLRRMEKRIMQERGQEFIISPR